MDGISATSSKSQLADSWYQISFGNMMRTALIPSIIISIILGVLAVWRIKQPDAVVESQFVSMMVVAYVLLFAVLTGWHIRRIDMKVQDCLVLMAFSGIVVGLLVAIVKIVADYHAWQLLRLIGEPIATASAACAVGYVAFWQLSKLVPSNK